jgi:hypothetical protein
MYAHVAVDGRTVEADVHPKRHARPRRVSRLTVDTRLDTQKPMHVCVYNDAMDGFETVGLWRVPKTRGGDERRWIIEGAEQVQSLCFEESRQCHIGINIVVVGENGRWRVTGVQCTVGIRIIYASKLKGRTRRHEQTAPKHGCRISTCQES